MFDPILIFMPRRVLFIAFFLFGGGSLMKAKAAQQRFEKSEFYSVMAAGDIEAINRQLDIVSASETKNKEGYEGALLMKKAGLVKKPKDKLSFFKSGRIKLETAILSDNENLELHFLRLAIEEHAPKIVKYRSDINADKLLVLKEFKNGQPAVQHAILDYCNNSKVLNRKDLTLPANE